MTNHHLNISSLIGGRAQNQDSFGSSETKHGLLIVVCDGMGGAKGGKTASELAVKKIMEQVEHTELTEAGAILTEALEAANNAVCQMGKANADLQGMGTTATVLLIDERKATAAHVGDSRIYQLRNGRKVFRTFDHSMVFELVKRGAITEEQARLSAESNVILRAIGTQPEIEVELARDLPYVKGDRFLLCSDGISGAVPEEQLIKLIQYDPSVDKTVAHIVETIDNVGKNAGGKHDNLTAALIEMNSNSIIKPKMSRIAKIIAGILSSLILISLCMNVYLIKAQGKFQQEIKGEYERSQIDSVVMDLKQEIKDIKNGLDTIQQECKKLKTVKK